ncbi:hypothetical protein D3C78_996110 [compost metagenome]
MHQALEGLDVAAVEVVEARRDAVEGALIFDLQGAIHGDDASAVLGELGAAALAPAGDAHHHGFGGEVVDGVDGVPGRLVGQRHGLGGAVDRTLALDGLEQAYAGVGEGRPDFGVERHARQKAGCVHRPGACALSIALNL